MTVRSLRVAPRSPAVAAGVAALVGGCAECLRRRHQWSGGTAATRSPALVGDPDASDGTSVRWTLFAIAPRSTGMR
jgi:hypothetical protein